MTGDKSCDGPETDTERPQTAATTEYCAKLQQWMWQYYWGYANWQSWVALSAFPFPPPCPFPPSGTGAQTPGTPASTYGSSLQAFDTRNWYPYPFGSPASSLQAGGAHAEQNSAAHPLPGTDARAAQQQQNGNPPQAGRAQFVSVAYFL